MSKALKKPKKSREYTIADLVNIAIQMNGRIRFDIIPIEMIESPKTNPSRDKPPVPQTGARRG